MVDSLGNASDEAIDDILRDLESMEPDEATIERVKFSRIYKGVAAALSRGASSRQILELLKAKGLELHHAKFGKLLRAELEARDERGERVYCVTCSQALKPKEKVIDDAVELTNVNDVEELK